MINPEKEKKINGLSDVKKKLTMIIVEDKNFAIWKEFIERCHLEELNNSNREDMYKG